MALREKRKMLVMKKRIKIERELIRVVPGVVEFAIRPSIQEFIK